MERKKEKKKANQMGSPPYHDATPPRMGRNPGSGTGGSGTSMPPNGAKYGLGEGKAPTRMDRNPGKGKGGNTFRVSGGPATSSRSDTGANKSGSQKYGVNGVSCNGAGHTGRYGGS